MADSKSTKTSSEKNNELPVDKEDKPKGVAAKGEGKGLKRKLFSAATSSQPVSSDDDDKKLVSCSVKRKKAESTTALCVSTSSLESSPPVASSTSSSAGNTPKRLTERQQMLQIMQMTADGINTEGSPRPSSPGKGSACRKTPQEKKVNKRNERGETPMHLAAIRGDYKLTKKLVKAGAEINVKDWAGWTPLHEACNHGCYDVARHLLRMGANVNVQGFDNDTPIHDAAINGHKKLVQLLLKYGADPTLKNKKGKSALDVACSSDITALLLKSDELACSSSCSSIDDIKSPLSHDSDFSDEDFRSSDESAKVDASNEAKPKSSEYKCQSRLSLKFQHIKSSRAPSTISSPLRPFIEEEVKGHPWKSFPSPAFSSSSHDSDMAEAASLGVLSLKPIDINEAIASAEAASTKPSEETMTAGKKGKDMPCSSQSSNDESSIVSGSTSNLCVEEKLQEMATSASNKPDSTASKKAAGLEAASVGTLAAKSSNRNTLLKAESNHTNFPSSSGDYVKPSKTSAQDPDVGEENKCAKVGKDDSLCQRVVSSKADTTRRQSISNSGKADVSERRVLDTKKELPLQVKRGGMSEKVELSAEVQSCSALESTIEPMDKKAITPQENQKSPDTNESSELPSGSRRELLPKKANVPEGSKSKLLDDHVCSSSKTEKIPVHSTSEVSSSHDGKAAVPAPAKAPLTAKEAADSVYNFEDSPGESETPELTHVRTSVNSPNHSKLGSMYVQSGSHGAYAKNISSDVVSSETSEAIPLTVESSALDERTSFPKVPPLRIILPQKDAPCEKNENLGQHEKLPYIFHKGDGSVTSTGESDVANTFNMPGEFIPDSDSPSNEAGGKDPMVEPSSTTEGVIAAGCLESGGEFSNSEVQSNIVQTSTGGTVPTRRSRRDKDKAEKDSNNGDKESICSDPKEEGIKEGGKDGNKEGGNERRMTRSLNRKKQKEAKEDKPCTSADSTTDKESKEPKELKEIKEVKDRDSSGNIISTTCSAIPPVNPVAKERKEGEAESESPRPRSKRNPRNKNEIDVNQPVLPPVTHHEKPENPYLLFQMLRKQIDAARNNYELIQPKAPHDYHKFLMVTKNYIIHDRNQGRWAVPTLSPPNSVTGPMRELFIVQEKSRYHLRLQHKIEREKLSLSMEQEIVREHGRAARAISNQGMPLSACSVFKDAEVYNMASREQEDKEKNVRARYSGRQLLSWLKDVNDKYEKCKEALLLRHHHEAESLHAVQKMEWEWRMRDEKLCDWKTTPIIDDLCVPMVAVKCEFEPITS